MSRNGHAWLAGVAVAAQLTSSACALGPRYVRPDTLVPVTFKEGPPAGWTNAQPNDAVRRGAWWSAFGDPALDSLEASVSVSNQNVLAAEARFRAAQAQVRGARAGLFPIVTTAPGATRSSTGSAAAPRQYDLPVAVTYQADVWGNIRKSVSANRALAQASAADLENARLLYQSELAADYFQLQGIDAEQRLLRATVESYQQYLQLTQDRFQGGVVSMGDVALAETQLETARAQLADLGIPRTQLEHAIAVLMGRPPSELSIPEAATQSPPPTLSVALPASLLERRPDVAAAEREVAAANAQIGIARTAYFSALTFGGSAGSQAAAIADLLTVPTRLWSVGAQAAETLFDGGKRRAQTGLARANYDTTVAGYRQTVLMAFQQVEDAVAALRILADETTIIERAVNAAQQSLDIATTQYRGGLVNYLQVITAQTELLQNQRAAVDLVTRRLVGSVTLSQALGGGWDAAQLSAGDSQP
jgi:NodT family efflux transporter outer membrane factor (OMF) lipoprotein